ncbi:hypothetical protein TrRE_jg9146, partial [Triparma retinervis]
HPSPPLSQPAPFHSASLYVGDLAVDVNEGLLFEIFNAVGPVASIRVCRDAVTRRSLGYAYVNFHQVSDAERALDTMNYTMIKTKPCRIMWSQRDPSLRKSGVGNIFVKNLHESIDNKQLYDTFSLFGNILSCKVVTDPETGASKGYGYVHYETAEAADAAISKLDGMTIEGLEVNVINFMRRNERPDQASWTNIYIKNIPLHWDDEKLKTKKIERERELKSMFDQMKVERINKFQGVNLYVKNLDDMVTDDQLREEFSSIGTITSARVMREGKEATSASRGFGFVCYSSPEEATKAVNEMNGKIINGKPIFVALAQRKEIRRAQLEAQHTSMGRGGPNIPGRMPMPMQGMYPGMPYAMLQPRGPAGVPQGYPMGMMMAPRGAPRGYPQMAGGRGAYPMPGYVGGRGPRGMPRGQPRGAPRGAMPRGQQGFQLKGNVRNAPVPQQAPAPQPDAGQLTPAALAAASPELQKNMIGERLYPLIHTSQPELAGKITGMLLEMDNGELLHLLESPEALSSKIKEAIQVLEAHAQSAAE